MPKRGLELFAVGLDRFAEAIDEELDQAAVTGKCAASTQPLYATAVGRTYPGSGPDGRLQRSRQRQRASISSVMRGSWCFVLKTTWTSIEGRLVLIIGSPTSEALPQTDEIAAATSPGAGQGFT